jgi:hypothetical protein
MLDKFNFYDLLGYLIPGGTVVLVLYWFAREVVVLPVPTLPTDLGGSLLFLGLSYAVGNVVQTVGSWYEKNWVNRRECGQRLSERLLAANDRRLSTGLKKQIIDCAQAKFGLSLDAHDSDPKVGRIAPRELFDLCYALVVQKGLAQHTEIFLAINGLARGMIFASWVGILIGVATVLNATRAIPLGPAPSPLKGGENPQLVAGAAGLVAFAIAAWLMRKAFNRFRLYFATSVYNSFVAFCADQPPTTQAVPPGGRRKATAPAKGIVAGLVGFALGAFASRIVRR